ncbi:AraC family transcriptional regulator [Cohnella sp. REN36]|uniref:AraC family transcriptional regulator n=1 Tax=Cohnella sp. REN36 TaxID=2887347 RepID=UPI001D15BF92|nr:AraC family transcriptional regulator [Cohnella sp. REN36]MCC3376187.1 AraC family transcriptional regulator [Cohnella sp. REN36]
MDKSPALREPMDMPDPFFPMKLHHCRFAQSGVTTFPHHWHEHLEFLYVVKGEARFSCNSESYDVAAGDLIVINGTDLHHGISLSDDLFYYALIVDPALLHSHTVDTVEAKYITPITQNRIRFANKIGRDEQDARACLAALIEEIGNREFGYELAVKSWLYRLLTVLLRHHVAAHFSPADYSSRIRQLERLDPVFRHVEEHYAERLTVDRLAGIARMSRFHFSRVFKELTNRSVTDYINFVRINKSEYELRHTEKTIAEIATANGFNDIYYFSRLFKSYKNVSPSTLRKTALPGQGQLPAAPAQVKTALPSS